MNSEEGSRRDEVFRGEKARKGCHCPVATPPASTTTSPWTCRSYRSSRSWCRRPDAGQRPDSEVCVRILWPIKLLLQPLIVSEDKDLNQCNEDKIKSTWPNIILGERNEESLVECMEIDMKCMQVLSKSRPWSRWKVYCFTLSYDVPHCEELLILIRQLHYCRFQWSVGVSQ